MSSIQPLKFRTWKTGHFKMKRPVCKWQFSKWWLVTVASRQRDLTAKQYYEIQHVLCMQKSITILLLEPIGMFRAVVIGDIQDEVCVFPTIMYVISRCNKKRSRLI